MAHAAAAWMQPVVAADERPNDAAQPEGEGLAPADELQLIMAGWRPAVEPEEYAADVGEVLQVHAGKVAPGQDEIRRSPELSLQDAR